MAYKKMSYVLLFLNLSSALVMMLMLTIGEHPHTTFGETISLINNMSNS